MNDEPKRWLDDGASSFERELLASADIDRAPSRALSRTLASVQVAAAATLVASTAIGTSASVGAIGVLKWVGIGVVSGLATMAVVETVTPSPVTNTQPAAVLPLAIPVASGAVVPEPGGTPQTKPAALPDPRSRKNSAPTEIEPPPLPAPSATQSTVQRDLVRETSLVSEASRRVDGGDATRALALLEQYAREYPTGVLRPEAAVVRVRALVAAGRRREAEQLATSRVGSEPGSAHARAMQRALGDTPAPKK